MFIREIERGAKRDALRFMRSVVASRLMDSCPRAAPERYHIIAAAGDVWIAEDLERGGRVELRFVAAPAPARAALLQRARAAAAIRHPNIAAIEDAGELGDEVYIASAISDGVSMRAWLDTGPERREIVAVWRAALDGTAVLHRAGVSHGALSLDRVRIGSGGVQIDGFGAAPPLTYQAIEILRGAPPSPHADQFALCVALWEALTGAPPFSGDTAGALAVEMTFALALPPDDRVRFGALWRGLAPEPARRWPNLAALAAAIDRRRDRRAVIAVAAGVAIMFGQIALELLL